MGVDLRDWLRPKSGVTARYLLARLRHVPYDSPLAAALRADEEAQNVPQKPTVERLRQRQREIEEQRAEEAQSA